MGFHDYLKDFATLASIFSLFAIGFVIVVKSGAVAVGGDRCRLVLGNLSHLVVGLAACVLLIAVIQQLVGLRIVIP